MDNLLIMGILQGSRDLSDVRQDDCQGEASALGMAFAQRAIGSIGHYQERDIVWRIHTKFEDAHNMLMIECRDCACLVEKAILLVACQSGAKYLDGGLRLEVHMLAKVDISEAALPQQAVQTVIAKLLSQLVSHTQSLLY